MQISANDMLLDRLITTESGRHLGMVDNLELDTESQPDAPVVTALLVGPSAFGPRLGGRLGKWWAAVGMRLRPEGPEPARIPAEVIKSVDRNAIVVTVSGDELGTEGLQRWLVDHLIGRIPGNGASR